VTPPKVFIIILNWNGLHDTLECLASTYKLDYPNFAVILVDNGSTDNAVNIIRATYRQIIILENRENLGYAAGNNRGIRYALKNNAQYVWLLNNDTVVESNSLTRLIQTAESAPDIGLVSPVIHDYENSNTVQSSGTVIDLKEQMLSNLTQLDPCTPDKPPHIILWGTALLIKRNVIDTIGFLNERYFAYYEDFDYCLRALQKGYRSLVDISSRVYHKDARSSGGRDSPLRWYLTTRNDYFFWMSRLNRLRKASYLRKYLSHSLSMIGMLQARQKYLAADACFDGVWNAMLGRAGPWHERLQMPGVMKRILSWHPSFWSHLLAADFLRISFQLCKRIKMRIINV